MKIIQREIFRVVPGKRTEALELLKKLTTLEMNLGAPPAKHLRSISGTHERMNTLIFELEWDSFALMESVVEGMYMNPEVQAMLKKWEPLVASHEIEFYVRVP